VEGYTLDHDRFYISGGSLGGSDAYRLAYDILTSGPLLRLKLVGRIIVSFGRTGMNTGQSHCKSTKYV
jgi:hypothetical protein